MDAFIYKLAIIFIPGIVGRFLLGHLLFIKDNDKFYFILHSFLLGVVSYIIFDIVFLIILSIFGDISDIFSMFHTTAGIFDLEDNEPTNGKIIYIVTVISCIFSTFWAKIDGISWLVRMFEKIGIQKREPEPYIWRQFNNSKEVQENRWIIVHDRKNDISYQGRLIASSYTTNSPELLLLEVFVYKGSTGEQISEIVNALYLSIESKRIEIEFLPTLLETEIKTL